MTALLLTRPTAPTTSPLTAAIEAAAGRALPADAVATIVGIVRDTRPAIPRTVWVAEQLIPTRARPTDAAMALATLVIDAVHAHDGWIARGGI